MKKLLMSTMIALKEDLKMGSKLPFVLTCLLIAGVLVACGPSQAELDAQATKVAAEIFATQTAEAPTPTNTPTSTRTPTNTPTPTPTDTPTPLPPPPTPTNTPAAAPAPAATPIPLPAGWRDHAASGFHIALPARWEAVDVDEEGFEAIFSMLEALDTEWAQNVSSTFTVEAIRETIKFWAMDSEPAGMGYATLNMTVQSQPFPIAIGDLCPQLQSLYEQMGFEVVAVECGLRINELDAGRATVRLPMGALAAKEYQYFYVRGRSVWAVTFAVDETEWSNYEAIFATAGESFRVD